MTEQGSDGAVQAAEAFIAKWKGVAASELSTSQSFLIDLCHLLGVDTPHPTPEQAYMFERPITFQLGDGTTRPGRIDLYRRGAFVLESKKLKAGAHTKGFDDAMLRARSQGEGYARALPAAEGRPPFVVVIDVGHRIELYSELSRSGATYTPHPDPANHRMELEALRRPESLDRLRRVWLESMSLDTSREAANFIREIANSQPRRLRPRVRLARLHRRAAPSKNRRARCPRPTNGSTPRHDMPPLMPRGARNCSTSPAAARTPPPLSRPSRAAETLLHLPRLELP